MNLNRLSILSHKQLQWRCPESEFDLTKKHHVWRCSVYDMEFMYKEECPFCMNKIQEKDSEINWSNLQLTSNVSTFYRPQGEKKRMRERKRVGRRRRSPVKDVDALIELINSM